MVVVMSVVVMMRVVTAVALVMDVTEWLASSPDADPPAEDRQTDADDE